MEENVKPEKAEKAEKVKKRPENTILRKHAVIAVIINAPRPPDAEDNFKFKLIINNLNLIQIK